MLRRLLFGLTAFAACLVASPAATAGDLDKYVPEDAKFFAHINVPKLFKSEAVRKAVPMAFDKYGEQLIPLFGMAKGMNPNMPDIPEEQIKEVLKQAADPKIVAGICDKAGGVVTDIVVAGSAKDNEPNMVIVIKCEHFKAEAFNQGMAMAGGMPGVPVKFEAIKKAKGTIFAMEVPNAPVKFYLSVPTDGILHMCTDEDRAEKAFAAASKPGAKLAELMTKEDKSDFIFFAGIGGEDEDYTNMSGNVTLDKDLASKVNIAYKDEAKAKDEAQQMNDKFGDMMEQLKGMLGDKAEVLKPHMEKSKATADGKNVKATMVIPGTVVEKLLGKD